MPEKRAQRAKSSLSMEQLHPECSSDTMSVSKRPKLMAAEEEEEINPPPSPGLQVAANSLIMRKIFEYSYSFQDLKNIRQVSKLWYNESLKKWREIAVVRITCPWNRNTEKGWDIDDYLETLQDNDDLYKLDQYPFKKYNLVCLPFFGGDDAQDPLSVSLENLWNTVGPLITHLELYRCTFFPQTEQGFERLITERLATLHSLVLTGNAVCNGFQRSDQHVEINHGNALEIYQAKTRNWNLKRLKLGGLLPVSLGILMMSAPNLETLEFGKEFDKHNRDIYQLYFCFRFLYDYRQIVDQRPFQIKNLDMMDLIWYKGPTHLTLNSFWMCTRYPVEKLALTLSNSSMDKIEDIPNMMIPTVRKLAGSLKVLTVYRPPVYKMTYQNAFVERMELLEELNLHGNIVWDFRFLDMMPNLKRLFIDFKCYDQEKRFEDIDNFRELYRPYKWFQMSTETVMVNMECLHLNFRPGLLLESIRTVMPSLKTLKAVLWQNEFRLVCQELPTLEELAMLYGSRIDDDTFTGMSGDSEDRHLHNITNLKCLKMLQIQNLCCGSETPGFVDARLGDKAVFKGLLELTTLKSVTICASSQMTTEAADALQQHVPSSRIIRNYKNAGHKDTGEDCCYPFSFAIPALGGFKLKTYLI